MKKHLITGLLLFLLLQLIDGTSGASFTSGFSASISQDDRTPVLSILPVNIENEISCPVEVYPNPNNEMVMIRIKNSTIHDFLYVLYDVSGKVMEQKGIESNITAVNIHNYSAGVYLLKVIKTNKEIRLFEIIKK